MAGKASRSLPAGVAEALSPAEQAHIDSAGAQPLPADETADTAAVDSGAAAGADASAAPGGDEPAAGGASDAAAGAAPAPEPAPEKRTVPLATLLEEREQRKAAEARAKLLEERTTQVLQAFTEGKIAPTPAAAGPKPAEPPAVPSLDDNPLGHLLGRLDRVEPILATVASILTGQHDASQSAAAERQRVQGVIDQVAGAEQAFEAHNPDYRAARDFTVAQLERQLTAQGVKDAAMRRRMLNGHAQQMVNHALANGLDPAAVAYDLAKAMGYRPGDAPRGAPPASGAAAVRAAADGQRRNGASLGSVRGAGPAPLTAQRLIEMTDAEFARAIGTPEGRALLGA